MVKADNSDVLARLETDLRRLIPSDWTWVLTPRAPTPRWSTQGAHVQSATRLEPDAELEFWSPGFPKESLLVQTKETAVPSELTKLLPRYATGRWLIAAEMVGPRARQVMDLAKISWVEFEGDCRIAAGPLFIERLGTRPRKKPRNNADRRYVANPFSGAALRMVRWLLIEPDREWTASDMQRLARASAGFVSRTFATLERDAFALRTGSTLRLVDEKLLRDTWAQAPAPADRRHERVTLITQPADVRSAIAHMSPRSRYALTTEAAADLIAPLLRYSRLEVYVDDVEAFDRALDLQVVPRGGNVCLIRPSDDGVFDGMREFDGITTVGWPQLYVDLRRKGEAGQKAASFLEIGRGERPAWGGRS